MGRSNAKSSTKAKRKAVEQDETGGFWEICEKNLDLDPPVLPLLG